MAKSLAITAVTAALRNVLGKMEGVPDLKVTTRPPDKARSDSEKGNQLNIFLYRLAPSASNQSADDPESLILTLSYFITAYGKDDDDTWSHLLLGNALRVLKVDREFTADQLKAGVKALLSRDDNNSLPTHARLLLETPSEEEMVRLWSLFQTPYRLSVAYQAEVTLPCQT